MPDNDAPRTPGLEEFEREARNFAVIAAAGGGRIEAQTARAYAKMFRDVSEGIARLADERDALRGLVSRAYIAGFESGYQSGIEYVEEMKESEGDDR